MEDKIKGCKNLDYREDQYPSCKLIKTDIGWWWERQELQNESDPKKVQFCKLRGRINGIFCCINKGEMNCFEDREI
jgi:hypothetical protein